MQSNRKFAEVRFFPRVLRSGKVLRLSPLQESEHRIDLQALMKSIGNIPTLFVLDEHLDSVMVEALHSHTFVGHAT